MAQSANADNLRLTEIQARKSRTVLQLAQLLSYVHIMERAMRFELTTPTLATGRVRQLFQ